MQRHRKAVKWKLKQITAGLAASEAAAAGLAASEAAAGRSAAKKVGAVRQSEQPAAIRRKESEAHRRAVIKEKSAGMTVEEVRRARIAHSITQALENPSLRTAKLILLRHSDNLSGRDKLLSRDLDNAEKLFGRADSNAGKSVSHPAGTLLEDHDAYEGHYARKQHLYGDLFFVDGKAMLISVATPLFKTQIDEVDSRDVTNLCAGLKIHMMRLQVRGFEVDGITFDGESALSDSDRAESILNTRVHIRPAASHVGIAERRIRVAKERARSALSRMSSNGIQLPRSLLSELMTAVAFRLNYEPAGQREDTTPPEEIYQRRKLDLNTEAAFAFGDYVTANHVSGAKNTLESRVEPALALRPCRDGQWVVLIRSWEVVRRKLSDLHKEDITREAIDEVNRKHAAEKAAREEEVAAVRRRTAARQQLGKKQRQLQTIGGWVRSSGETMNDEIIGPAEETRMFRLDADATQTEARSRAAERPPSGGSASVGETTRASVGETTQAEAARESANVKPSALMTEQVGRTDKGASVGETTRASVGETTQAEAARESANVKPSALMTEQVGGTDERTDESANVKPSALMTEQVGRNDENANVKPSALMTEQVGRNNKKASVGETTRASVGETTLEQNKPHPNRDVVRSAKKALANEAARLFAKMLKQRPAPGTTRTSDRAGKGQSKRYSNGSVKTPKKVLDFMDMYGEQAVFDAIVDELTSFVDDEVFEPVYVHLLTPEQRRLILRSKLVLKAKHLSTGEFERVRARICAGGDMEDKASFSTLYSPTTSTEAAFAALSIAAHEQRKVKLIDLQAAYLKVNVLPGSQTYVRLGVYESHVLATKFPIYRRFLAPDGTFTGKLQKALYGICQAAARLYDEIKTHLVDKLGLRMNRTDTCVFNKSETIDGVTRQITVVVFVDDLLITAHADSQLDSFTTGFKTRFPKITEKVLGENRTLSYLGMTCKFPVGEPECRISMTGYTVKMAKLWETAHANACREDQNITGHAFKKYDTPADANMFDIDESSPHLLKKQKEDYHSLVATCLFLSKRARPDLQFAVSFNTTRVKEPRVCDWLKLRRLVSYAYDTKDTELVLRPRGIFVEAYADASFATHHDKKSHLGVIVTIGGALIYASSKRAKINALSAAEAEMQALSATSQYVIWAQHFLEEQGYKQLPPAHIHEDSKATLDSEAPPPARTLGTT
jgi:hypothetical protein